MVLKTSDVAKKKEEFRTRNIELVSEFTKVIDHHTFRCLVDGYEWQATFDNIFRGKGCPKCKHLKVGIKNHELFINTSKFTESIELLATKGVILVSPYTRSINKHTFECSKSSCRHQWQRTFNSMVSGSTGCAKCYEVATGRNIRRITPEMLSESLTELSKRNIALISEFTSPGKRHNFKCLVESCKHEWITALSHVLSKTKPTGCPRCAGQVLTEEERRNSLARDLIIKRLSSMFRKGQTKSKIHHDDKIMSVLTPHWLEQHKLISAKPEDKTVTWYLDHIVPCNWFDPYDIEQLKLCWHHKNCQWLSSSENAAKQARIRTQDMKYLTDWHLDIISKASYARPLPILNVSRQLD